MLTGRLAALAAAALLLASCSRQPAYYSPQESRAAAQRWCRRVSHYTAMNAPGAENHIVAGILAAGGHRGAGA